MKSRNTEQSERNLYVQLRHLAAEIPVGATDNRVQCPFCEGGRNKDRGFSITRVSEAEARYYCHRATCHRGGRLAVWGFRLRQESNPDKPLARMFTPRVYTGNTGELGESWLSELLEKYELSREEVDWASWREDLDSKRLVCPVFSPGKVLRGHELRLGRWQVVDGSRRGPKTSHFKNLDDTWMGWYRKVKSGPVLLVEDCISALKGARHFPSAALLGSHLSLDHLLEAVEVAGDFPIFLALDKDATDKTMKFISEWRFIAPNLVARPLSKDLKYYTDQEILELNHGS